MSKSEQELLKVVGLTLDAKLTPAEKLLVITEWHSKLAYGTAPTIAEATRQSGLKLEEVTEAHKALCTKLSSPAIPYQNSKNVNNLIARLRDLRA